MNGTKDGTHRQDPVDLIAGFSHVFVLRRPGGILVTVLRGVQIVIHSILRNSKRHNRMYTRTYISVCSLVEGICGCWSVRASEYVTDREVSARLRTMWAGQSS